MEARILGAGATRAGWWGAYLPGVAVEAVAECLRECGVPERAVVTSADKILSLAARCRLAFAQIDTVREVPDGSSSVPSQAIIGQTGTHKQRGRPSTARWAFWAALIVAYTFAHTVEWKRATSRQLAELVSILLSQQVGPEKVRSQLAQLRREAEVHARATAEALLQDPMKSHLTEQAFAKHMRTLMEQDLTPSTEFPPMIVRGRLNEAWLQRLMIVRRGILETVHQHGPLGGEAPTLQLLSIAEVRHGLPLSGPGSLGTVHLDKGVDAAIPTVQEPAGRISVTLSLDKPPYGVVLCAFPHWWESWQAAILLPTEAHKSDMAERGGASDVRAP